MSTLHNFTICPLIFKNLTMHETSSLLLIFIQPTDSFHLLNSQLKNYTIQNRVLNNFKGLINMYHFMTYSCYDREFK